MSFVNEADRPVRRAAQRRPSRPLNRAVVVSIIEFFDAEEGAVWQIQRADGTSEVQVEADISQPR